MGSSKTLILIDGHALAFRSFFALERTGMHTTDNTPTWAVYGFFKAIFDLLKNDNISPDAIAVAFDVSRKTFRLERYEGYKANRETMPDALRPQFGLIMEGLKAFDIPIYTKEGFEGDDIIGTVAAHARALGHKTVILTGDKDSLQLIDKEGFVCVLIPSKGELLRYDWEKVHETLGVWPNQVVDYKALCGDSSDNIPGVKGIGPKTAVDLLLHYGTLEKILENASEISKPALREKIINDKENALLSQFLATIKCDVEIDFDFEHTCLAKPENAAVSAFLQKVQFYSFLKNIDGILSFFNHCEPQTTQDDKIAPSAQAGTQLGLFAAEIDTEGVDPSNVDTEALLTKNTLASYIKDSSRKHDFTSQVQNYLHTIPPENPSAVEFAAYLTKLDEFYNTSLNEKEKKLLNEVELPLSAVLRDMEAAGVSLDVEYLKTLGKYIEGKITEFEGKIYAAAGERFNINSPKQVQGVLFDKMQIKPKKKIKTGFSTSAKVLEELAEEFEIARDILEHRQLMKLKTTYIDALPKLVAEDGRVHTHFNQTVTTTGRLSSSEPNLQNIPIRSELGARIRSAFVPSDRQNSVLLSADYSQIELRLLAHYSGDKALIEAFSEDEDIHTTTAAKVFGVSQNDVTKEMRSHAKAVNFGIIYGQTRYGLASALGITPFEAQNFIDKYFQTYPKIRTYMNKTLMQAHQEGFVETILGRRRYLRDELSSRNKNIREFAERAAINAPLQGSSADLIKIAMVNLYEKLKGKAAKIILQVHDELVLEVPLAELEEVKKIVKQEMEGAQTLAVPLKVDLTVGKTWKEERP
jgi:DNA polymerase-1